MGTAEAHVSRRKRAASDGTGPPAKISLLYPYTRKWRWICGTIPAMAIPSCHGRSHVAALVVAALMTAIPLAFAGDAGKGSDPSKAAALAHFETAGRLYDVREYGHALEEYKAAYLAKPDPAFLFNIGQCHRKLGQNTQALDFFQQFLKKSPSDNPNRSQVEVRIADIQAEERLKAAPPPVTKAEPSPPNAAPAQAAPAPSPVPRDGPFGTAEPAPQSVPLNAFPVTAAPAANPVRPGSAGTDLSLDARTAPAADGQPIYGKWWFWTGVGVVVAGAATTAYLVSSKGGTSIPSTPMGNRPVFQ